MNDIWHKIYIIIDAEIVVEILFIIVANFYVYSRAMRRIENARMPLSSNKEKFVEAILLLIEIIFIVRILMKLYGS